MSLYPASEDVLLAQVYSWIQDIVSFWLYNFMTPFWRDS